MLVLVGCATPEPEPVRPVVRRGCLNMPTFHAMINSKRGEINCDFWCKTQADPRVCACDNLCECRK